jgi:AhpD family alkylhydroperoxidase
VSGVDCSPRLGATTREEIALVVAEVNDCSYCLSAHPAIGAGSDTAGTLGAAFGTASASS